MIHAEYARAATLDLFQNCAAPSAVPKRTPGNLGTEPVVTDDEGDGENAVELARTREQTALPSFSLALISLMRYNKVESSAS